MGAIATAAFATLTVPTASAAEEVFGAATFQDDFFFGHDGGGYSSGFFVSRIRLASLGENGIEPPWLLAPLVGWLGMPRSTLAAFSVGQIIFTPRDISLPIPDPDDAPYVGALATRSTHVSVHDATLDMLAIELGVVGPASGAGRTQRFVHRLIGSERPAGWASQVSNRPLASVERYRGWRLSRTVPGSGPANGDVVALAGGTIGNLESSIGATILLRYGVDLERSLPTVARITGRASDPVALGRGWFAYAAVSADRAFSHVGLGSDGPDGNRAQLRRWQDVGVVGIAYGWGGSSLSFSLQSANPLVESSKERQSYGSLTYTWLVP